MKSICGIDCTNCNFNKTCKGCVELDGCPFGKECFIAKYIKVGAMENFFGRLKVEMFYGEKIESVNAFIDELKKYIDYCNNKRISLKLKGMSPVQYQTHSLTI